MNVFNVLKSPILSIVIPIILCLIYIIRMFLAQKVEKTFIRQDILLIEKILYFIFGFMLYLLVILSWNYKKVDQLSTLSSLKLGISLVVFFTTWIVLFLNQFKRIKLYIYKRPIAAVILYWMVPFLALFFIPYYSSVLFYQSLDWVISCFNLQISRPESLFLSPKYIKNYGIYIIVLTIFFSLIIYFTILIPIFLHLKVGFAKEIKATIYTKNNEVIRDAYIYGATFGKRIVIGNSRIKSLSTEIILISPSEIDYVKFSLRPYSLKDIIYFSTEEDKYSPPKLLIHKKKYGRAQ